MIPILGVLLTIGGIIINISIPTTIIAPDISGSVLIAALAARRRHWPWTLPLLVLHDIVLYWSLIPPTPLFTTLALLLVIQIDTRLGPALLQRIIMIIIAHIPMWLEGWPVKATVLSFLLSFVLWYGFREQNASHTNAEFL